MELGTVSNFEKKIQAKLNLNVHKVFISCVFCVLVYYLNNITCGTKAEILAVSEMVCHS